MSTAQGAPVRGAVVRPRTAPCRAASPRTAFLRTPSQQYVYEEAR
ncbi:hypothetical protein [Streptomyces triticiradicis]|nr:hypothetical protein [Streptomyces triticiradicis]